MIWFTIPLAIMAAVLAWIVFEIVADLWRKP